MKPVIILASANDPHNYLEWIGMEQEKIKDYLQNNLSNAIEIVKIENASIENLFSAFIEHGERIIMFHFSGHANNLNLSFEGNIQGRSVNIAKLLATSPQLELVFLNGCGTAGHLTNLFNYGVKKIIATSNRVNDKTAAYFAIYFYAAFCRHWSLAGAFDFARNYALTNENSKYFDPGKYRSLKTSFTNEEMSGSHSLPWGLYINEAIPGSPPEQIWLPGNINQVNVVGRYTPNNVLIKSFGGKSATILDKLEEQREKLKNESLSTSQPPDIERMNAEIRGIDMEIDEFHCLKEIYTDYIKGNTGISKLADTIIEMLSYPLGGLLRQMISEGIDISEGTSTGYKDLLDYQIRFYDTLVKLCSFTMLSDLCELLLISKNISINQIQLDFVKSFFNLKESEKDDFDYTSFIKIIREIIECNNRSPFITEYEDLKNKFKYSEVFFESHMLIKGIKHKQCKSLIHPAELQSYCYIVEKELCNIFDAVYFILRYKLVAIKSIEIIKSRLDVTGIFQHNVLVLHKGSSSIIGGKELIHKVKYSDSYSVIITKGLSDISRFLSLSPFMIDRKVQIGDENSELFFFSHVNNGIVFEGVEDPTKRIEIQKLDDNSIPYVDTLDKQPNEIRKIRDRLTMINTQFQDFKAMVQELRPTQI